MRKTALFLMALILVVLPVFSSCGGAEEELSPSVVISETDIQMSVGDVYTLSARIFPKKFQQTPVIWSVSDGEIISCDNGRISAKAPGTALVFATVGSAKHSCRITVSENRQNMIIGEQIALDSTMREIVAKAKEISTSSDVISYADGKITANKLGDATLSAHYENGDRVTLATVHVVDVSLACDGMPITLVTNSSVGTAVELYGLQVKKQLYSENNYLINFSFKYKRCDNVTQKSERVNFVVTLYSGEVEGEFCRKTNVSILAVHGEEYTYIDAGFLAELKGGEGRTFWIEVTPVEDEK